VFLDELAQVSSPEQLEELLTRCREILHPGIVQTLAELAREQTRVNAQESLRTAEAALAVGRKIADPESEARGLRAKANSLWVLNQNRAAVELFDQAAALYRQCGNETEVGRTISSSLQALIRLGEYPRALEDAARAREIFTGAGDTLRLARLELNVANIHHRQDRYTQALEAYEKAYGQLVELRDTEAIAVALHNMAVCLIGLNDFPRALSTHERAREFSREHGMPAIAVQADYNISYLYYLRGEYSRALEGLRAASAAARQAGDAYHVALCALDSSEIYLELNMSGEAAEMAQEAFEQFQQLGMNYEAAKSLVNLAIAAGQPRSAARSLELFARARALFVEEKNPVWPSLIDLYQALVLYDAGRFSDARPLCAQALEFFRARGMGSKQVLCELLLARLDLQAGDPDAARAHCTAAVERLGTVEAPHLFYQASFLMGQIEESAGRAEEARSHYLSARQSMESLRSILRGEELKIAFMKNKLEVYEALIQLGDRSGAQIFDYMEQAKSRSLLDLFLEQPDRAQPGAAMKNLRDELNWYYHRIELEQTGPEEAPAGRIDELQNETRSREKALVRMMRAQAPASPEAVPSRAADEARAALGNDTVLVEYFRARDRILAAIVTREGVEIAPLAAAAEVAPVIRLLQFQFSKFNLGKDYIDAIRPSSLNATRTHLGELYQLLAAPIRHRLTGKRLVFAPHENLHNIPLHALHDGERYLIDSFAVSYAPSASIYASCCAQQVNTSGPSLVLALPDDYAPHIEEEAHTVVWTLPDAELFTGASASSQVLRERGPGSRYIHIGTHGRFRHDNPMFSAIRLGDGYLTLYDLYQMRLPADLITLSGCSTGLSVVAKGDELLGLVRGLLTAGARAVLLTLWDVQDRTTADLMKSFYLRLGANQSKAEALRGAMQELRARHPHPYYWAPFVLIGGE
jgi:CHAT domain-containing protein